MLAEKKNTPRGTPSCMCRPGRRIAFCMKESAMERFVSSFHNVSQQFTNLRDEASVRRDESQVFAAVHSPAAHDLGRKSRCAYPQLLPLHIHPRYKGYELSAARRYLTAGTREPTAPWPNESSPTSGCSSSRCCSCSLASPWCSALRP